MEKADNKGEVTREADGFRVRFVRMLDFDIETVWDAITNPEKLRLWFTDFEMDFRPGGRIIIRFRDEAGTLSYGQIVSIEKPTHFVFTWEGELADWELESTGHNQCKLTLTYSKLSDEYAINAPAGFHSLLDRLESMLHGETKFYAFGTEENDPDHLQMKQEYTGVVLKEYPELIRYQPIIVERTYRAPVERVWRAITEKDQMRQWYFDLEEFKAEVGFEFQFKGQGVKGEEYLHLCTITEVEPLKKLTYSWSYQSYDGTSYVSFELFTDGDQTTLRLTHRGLHTFPDNPDFARENFNGGWNELIGKLLKDFVEN